VASSPAGRCAAVRSRRCRRAPLRVQAAVQREGDETDDAKARVEAVERMLSERRKSRKGKFKPDSETSSSVSPEATPAKSWDEMSSSEKVVAWWLGEKGGLFWLNRLSWGATIFLAVLWILFRFVGPNLGLYDLENGLVPPA